MSRRTKLSVGAFVLMIITSVFGVSNLGTGFYRMGYASIPMFLIGGFLYFFPFTLMMIELGTGFDQEEGGIYTWMEKSVSSKFAFVGIMMWYSSYIIWMFSKALASWIPLSFALFGKDITVNSVMIGGYDFGQFILGILGVLLILSIYYVVSNGNSKITKVTALGGFAVIALNFILLIGGVVVYILNGFELTQHLTLTSLIQSPNPDYRSALPYLGFLVFAVFAFGGTEAIAGMASELENPQKNLKKSIYIAASFIIIFNIIGFVLIGSIIDWNTLNSAGDVNSASAIFIIMTGLGDAITGVDNSVLGQFLVRFSGLGIFISYMGAFVALSYAPLKQVINGSPKEIWPKSFEYENEKGIRVNALKVQSLIVIVFILVKSILSIFNPESASHLFELLITMINVGMTIPYLFLIYSWYRYRKNDKLKKSMIMIKSDKLVSIVFFVVFITVIFGNLFTMITPFIPGETFNLEDGIWTLVGPTLFAIIALILYKKYESIKK